LRGKKVVAKLRDRQSFAEDKEERMNAESRIILPIDVTSLDEARDIVEELGEHVGLFKIGYIQIYSLLALLATGTPADWRAAQEFFDLIRGRMFLDCKLLDIAKTVADAVAVISRLEPYCFNIHAGAKDGMIKDAVHAANQTRKPMPVWVVTALTDMNSNDTMKVFRRKPITAVKAFASSAVACGCQGVICSPQEAKVIRVDHPDITIATPGIRPTWSAADGQVRITTPAQAIENGADFEVIGSPILNARKYGRSRVAAAQTINEEIATALSRRR